MRRRASICSVGLIIFLAPATLRAQLQHGDWELTLAGTGVSPAHGGIAAGARAGIGYFLTDQFEFSLRQQVAYSDIGAPGAFFGQTRFALDFNLAFGNWQPFIGAQFAYQYGDLVSDSLEAGPELGIRYFVNRSTFIYATAEYDVFFNSSGSSSSSEDNQFAFAIGIGFKL